MPTQAKGDPPVSEYPEHEKVQAVKDRSQAIGEFLEWLTGTKGVVICEHKCPHGYWPMSECEESRYCRGGDNSAEYWPIREQTEALLAEFFGVDRDKLEDEKLAMLALLRAANS